MNDDDATWDLNGLRRVIFATLEERDKRYEQRFSDQTTAIHKQETAIEKRFEGVNELRGIVNDTYAQLMPRAEAMAKFDGLQAKIDDHSKQDQTTHNAINSRIDSIARRQDIKEGEQLGSKDTKGDTRALWAIVISFVAVAFSVIFSLMTK